MKKLLLMITSVMILIFFISAVSASVLAPTDDKVIEQDRHREHPPFAEDNKYLERADFIHYAKSSRKERAQKAESCYKLMGVKWSTLPVSYSINPINPQNLSESFISSTITASAETWDAATSQELFNNFPAIDNTAQYGIQNFQNAIVFGDYPDSGVIGITSVWFTRVGKRIVEFDMLLNTDFQWGDATIDPLKMDLQNIATHELGHSIGLSDIYSTSCSTVTMFGYSTESEISKRSLDQPDIFGLQKMYEI